MTQRKADGESAIYYDRGDGRWHGWVSFGRRSDGTRDRRHRSGRTRGEVLGKVRDLERVRDVGRQAPVGRAPTVREWLEHWLTAIAAPAVRPSTLAGYTSKVHRYLIPGVGQHRLSHLRPDHLEELYAELHARGLSSATILQAHRIMSRALKVAMRRGLVGQNVATLIDAPSLSDRDEVQPLTAEEARAVLAAAAGTRNAARWSVALAIGLRQGEALGMTWDHLDLENGTVRVRWALQRVTGRGLVLVPPKSRAGRRVVKLPTPLVAALRAHRAEQIAERLRAGSEWRDVPHGGYVFAQPNGRPVDPKRDWLDWKALLRRAGVRDARVHDMRHTCATLMLVQGVPARVVMGILGHSQITLTLGTYSHVVPELADHAAERIGDALWPPVATEVATEDQQMRPAR